MAELKPSVRYSHSSVGYNESRNIGPSDCFHSPWFCVVDFPASHLHATLREIGWFYY